MINDKFDFDISEFSKIHLIAKDISNILLTKAEEIPIESVTSKICVSRPYFAFNKIFEYNGVLIAPIRQEQPLSFESTPITSAETSRHLAILGSCALSTINDEKKYYLAVKARKRAGQDLIEEEFISKFDQTYALAMPLYLNKKEAAAITVLVNLKGQIIFDFKVEYQVFSKELFARVFREYSKPTKKIEFNPYFEAFSFSKVVVNENILRAEMPRLTVDKCAGHFDDFPMWASGVLSYMAINAIEIFLNNITNNSNLKYYLLNADMDVISPVSFEEKVELKVTYLGCVDHKYNFIWVMNNLSTNKNLNVMKIAFCVSHEVFSFKRKVNIDKIEQQLTSYKMMYADLAYENYQQKYTQTKILQ